MSLATVRFCALAGVTALPVVVEVHLGGGLPGMAIVGLPESAVRESKDRVRAAIRHAGFRFPKVKVVVNLAPADLPKRGGRFDLPIALGILAASDQPPAAAVDGLVVVGELGLGGELRPVGGALPAAQACRESGQVSSGYRKHFRPRHRDLSERRRKGLSGPVRIIACIGDPAVIRNALTVCALTRPLIARERARAARRRSARPHA